MKKIDPKQSLPKMEEEILKYWEEQKIFEQSVNRESPKGDYVFYDGPPFATGTPHYGHIVASTLKDTVPRYWTMRGYRVERKWGWDCHGLPIENIAEKALGVKSKKDIEVMGVEKFNEFCRSTVLQYTDDWRKVITRLGRWADMEHPYKTMDLPYMESVWWVFKQLWDKGLIYENYRIMHVCTRCETTLSQSEVSEGYMNVKDLSATVKFKLDAGQQIGDFVTDDNTFILAWTTTPWTLPGNVALAVGKDIEYVKIQVGEEFFIIAQSRLQDVMKEKGYEVMEKFLGEKLVGKKYIPLFDTYSKDETLENHSNGWKIYAAEFVNTEEGTGVVHIAPAFGEDDWELLKKEQLPFVQHVNLDGTIKEEVKELVGLIVKPKETPQATDVEVIKYLAGKGLLFSKEKYEHSYPHCWRCDTPLINYATSSWFVKVTDVKDRALETAKEINWSPEHIKEGRFGKWLEGARDWSISRQRFWASVMPIWRCEQCAETKVFGSVQELEAVSGATITDLHKHIVDTITFSCEQCSGTMKRVPDVLDTWFDSGSMPYAQAHYPFENKETFEARFPAQFIAEGIDQTRAWFYYLHILGTALMDKPAFKNVVVNGIVQAEDGKKMSKRLSNYPDTSLMFDKYGADALRLYLLSSPIVSAENLNFLEKDMSEVSRNVFRMLWNSYSFFVMYAEIDNWSPSLEASANQGKPNGSPLTSDNILDRWILSELQTVIREVNVNMEQYDIARATRLFAPFIDNLSNWYIRRSRKRFWKNEDESDKNNAYQTLYDVLVTLAKLMAPFTPFISEEIYRNLTSGSLENHNLTPTLSSAQERGKFPDSVHLAEYPVADGRLIDESLSKQMVSVRYIVSKVLQMRADKKIKVRQPLQSISIGNDISLEMQEIIKEETNIKQVLIDRKLSDIGMDDDIELDTNITPELKLEGQAREVIRFIQELRKEAGFEVDDRIQVGYQGFEAVFDNAELKALIAKEVLAAKGLSQGIIVEADITKETVIDDMKLAIWLKR
ncbi:MAG: isoleucine--tRNA ligase [Candidatus Moraniibacteriota bacterium]